jgi:hypothetical protein
MKPVHPFLPSTPRICPYLSRRATGAPAMRMVPLISPPVQPPTTTDMVPLLAGSQTHRLPHGVAAIGPFKITAMCCSEGD